MNALTDVNLAGLSITVYFLGFLPFFVVMSTAYTKLIVVLMILRQALGLQQIPPNIVLYGITMALTLFISQPLINNVSEIVNAKTHQDMSSFDDFKETWKEIKVPYIHHLKKFSNPREIEHFHKTAQKLWETKETIDKDNFLILLPSFVISELTSAFKIGFMIFLPFLIIDLIVANILISMGAIMVPPTVIAMPIKIFLFVMVEGWSKLIHSLIVSYI
jgi:type III secretion protein R